MDSGPGLFADSFDWAVVRLATYFPEAAQRACLLFGAVELLSRDRPRPRSGPIEKLKIGPGKRASVFVRKTVMQAEAAIEWYRQPGHPDFLAPAPAPPDDESAALETTPLAASAFEDDPVWPALGLPLDADLFSGAGGPGDPAPFRGSGNSRIHRRFGDDTGFDVVLGDPAALQFLKRRLHVDLGDYTEYLGGLALVVPDPVLRHIQHRLVKESEAGEGERVVFRLSPQAGQTLEGLQITMLERRSNLLSRFETIDVPLDGVVVLESSVPFDQTGYVVSHPRHGVLAYQQPLPFIRAVRASIAVAGRRVEVQTSRTAARRSPLDTYLVTEYANEVPVSVGEERRDAGVRIAQAALRRQRRAAAQQSRQTWFEEGDRKGALEFLRRQMARARTSVLVADPYFGGLQTYQVLHATPRTGVEFTILTSRLAFEGPAEPLADGNDATAPFPPEAEHLDLFERSLSSLRERGITHVSALVLGGKSPRLHDRFLVIDEEVLFLGNSLNMLGERASLIMAVADSGPILSRLVQMARSAERFEDYRARRLQRLLISPREP